MILIFIVFNGIIRGNESWKYLNNFISTLFNLIFILLILHYLSLFTLILAFKVEMFLWVIFDYYNVDKQFTNIVTF